MTGFGSPCGACKFLRRKCVRGCIFAPYFCHEQGAAHFAAIHKVFGASNVSKLLMHLPVADRCEAAVTISYEAQARLQDPIYGCVAHIFTLQQQVVNLQAQLASLKAQAAAQGCATASTSTSTSTSREEKLNNKFPPYQQDGQGFFQGGDLRTSQALVSDPMMNPEAMLSYGNELLINPNFFQSSQECHPHSYATGDPISFSAGDNYSCAMASPDMQANTRRPAYHDMEDLQSVTFAYLHHA
ncbi:LOB domain-containing protein 29-like [Phoenix dactylifera]|uniref:LOB domain-containing protein 29-like n=1 Tax=Phoenix dactylifera TaxID=42345 RepID=A0A8B7BXS3_PHODC|nr:LOB domain-containing protein 29-like [Phoenix dactylifera]